MQSIRSNSDLRATSALQIGLMNIPICIHIPKAFQSKIIKINFIYIVIICINKYIYVWYTYSVSSLYSPLERLLRLQMSSDYNFKRISCKSQFNEITLINTFHFYLFISLLNHTNKSRTNVFTYVLARGGRRHGRCFLRLMTPYHGKNGLLQIFMRPWSQAQRKDTQNHAQVLWRFSHLFKPVLFFLSKVLGK